MRGFPRTLLCLILLLFAVPAAAQVDPAARVGRVAFVSGTLAYYGPGDADWSAAPVNLPIATGAWLATDSNSRAEIRLSANSAYLSYGAQVDFAQLNDKTTQIALTQGRVDLRLRGLTKEETSEVDVPRGGVWLLQPGLYDIDTGGPDRPTRIIVFEGSARFVGGGIDTIIEAGDQLLVSGDTTLTSEVGRASPDDFVRWCRSQDYQENRLAAPYHVSPGMTGYEQLDQYGEWAADPTYGQVWFPTSVGADWVPYRDGRWVWIEPWGWNWVDDEPWGFAPFHYGRWARLDDRWGWVPGEFVAEPVYAPALVAFISPVTLDGVGVIPVEAGTPIGWFPLAPGEVYWPGYTRDPTYIRNVNVTNVNVTQITNIISAGATRANSLPPQIANQQFANRTAATVVPSQVLLGSARVASATIPVPPKVLQQASIKPPAGLLRPAPTAIAPVAQPGAPIAGTPPPTSNATTPVSPTAVAPTHPPAKPNFTQLLPAPRVAQTPGTQQQQQEGRQLSPVSPPRLGSPVAGTPAPQPNAYAAPAASPPGHPPAPPDFSHLAPSRIGPHPGPSQQQTIAPPPSVGATNTAIPHPSSGRVEAHGAPPATAPPASGLPPAQPNFSNLRPGQPAAPRAPQPTLQAGREPVPPVSHAPTAPSIAAPSPTVNQAAAAAQQQAQQHAAAQAAAAQQQAQQRAAAQAAATQQQAQQRAAAQAAAAQQQAQQRAAAQATAAQQQAQQRAAAQAAAAQQQAQQRAAAQAAAAQQQAQQRAAAQAAAAQQQAQQRAAAQAAAAQQQAQQRAATQRAAPQQHANACGHPGQPPCPR